MTTVEALRQGASKSVVERNPGVFGVVRPEPPRLCETKLGSKESDAREAELQARCEQWLEGRGYRRRTPKKLQAHHFGRWMVHLARPQGNPVLLDLLLLDSAHGRYIEIELKTPGGRLSPDQQSLCFRGEGELVRSFEEFQGVVTEWEEACNA